MIVRADPLLSPNRGGHFTRRPHEGSYQAQVWTAKTSLPELVRAMIEADYASARRDSMVKLAGLKAYDNNE